MLPCLCLLCFICFLLPGPASAFYEWRWPGGYIELRGLLRVSGTAYENPENEFFFADSSFSGFSGIGRVLIQGRAHENFGFEVNAYQTCIPQRLVTSRMGLGTSPDVERSDTLEWGVSNNPYAHLIVDRLRFSWSQGRLDLIAGRQPINLSTTFFFTPNDFFAPFAAQAFYRVYKPGVDALRADIRLENLSQLSLIGVLGYRPDPGSDSGWSDQPDSDRASYIGRISRVFLGFDWALMGGTVRDRDVIGGSLQGELFRWLGVRAEGHMAFPHDFQRKSYGKVAVDLEHRWENSLNIRLEQFYNGNGFHSVSEYMSGLVAVPRDGLYLGRFYAALEVGYEFTPLLNSEILLTANLEDDSCLGSFYTTYSLSDEAELAFNLGVPLGKKPQDVNIMSEFGLYPYFINVEVRYYF